MTTKRHHQSYRRSEQTDYQQRLSLLKSGKIRLVVRLSNKNIIAQLVKYNPDGDRILSAASSKELEKKGWKASRSNLPAAYLLGYLLANKSNDIKEAILDIGKLRSVHHSRVYALVKGVIDGGIKVPAGEQAFPSAERIQGQHIKTYAEKLVKEKSDKIFSKYTKNNIDPKEMPKYFDEVKSKIKGGN